MKNKMPRLNKKILSSGNLFDESEEKKYWLSKNAHERLQAIEINRHMVYGKNRITSRLQRFLETVSLTQR